MTRRNTTGFPNSEAVVKASVVQVLMQPFSYFVAIGGLFGNAKQKFYPHISEVAFLEM